MRTPAEIFALMLAALQRGAKTRDEIAEAAGVTTGSVRRFIDALRNQGLVYVQKRRKSRSKPAEIFALNPMPFQFEDATTITV